MSNTLPLSAKPVPATFASVVPSDRNRSRDAWFVLIAVNISVKRSVCYASASCWRGLLLERLTLRLELAQAWAVFCTSPPDRQTDNVVTMGGR